jgi:hypothetical protein
MCVCICMCVCVCVCLCVCVYICVYIFVCVCMYSYRIRIRSRIRIRDRIRNSLKSRIRIRDRIRKKSFRIPQHWSQNSRNQGFSYYFCMMKKDPNPYLWLVDPVSGGPKPCGFGGSGSETLLLIQLKFYKKNRMQNAEWHFYCSQWVVEAKKKDK